LHIGRQTDVHQLVEEMIHSRLRKSIFHICNISSLRNFVHLLNTLRSRRLPIEHMLESSHLIV
jgi:hypothetical protein